MSSTQGLKIEKLLRYVGSSRINYYAEGADKFLKKRDETFIKEYIPARDTLKFDAWDECRDSTYNKVSYEIAVSKIGEVVYSSLYNKAIHKGALEYQEIEDNKRMRKIEDFTRAKVFGQSVSFITEDLDE